MTMIRVKSDAFDNEVMHSAEAARHVVGVLKVQGSALDMEYLWRWAAALGLADLLQRVLADAE